MKAYEPHIEPPAPVALVVVADPVTGRSGSKIPMLIDTGADVTVLPASAAVEVGLEVGGEFELRWIDGEVRSARWVQAKLKWGKLRIPGRFVLSDHELGLLGRDVLNEVVLELDGPRQIWDMRRR
jgi:predicted aspartyl protease